MSYDSSVTAAFLQEIFAGRTKNYVHMSSMYDPDTRKFPADFDSSHLPCFIPMSEQPLDEETGLPSGNRKTILPHVILHQPVTADLTDLLIESKVSNLPSYYRAWFLTLFTTDETGKRTGKNTIDPLAIVADYDGGIESPTDDRLTELGLPLPTVRVKSGGGYHLWWFLLEDSCTKEQRHDVVVAIAAVTEADSAMKDAARMLRLPGSIHLKNPADPKVVTILESNYDRRYTYADFQVFTTKNSPQVKQTAATINKPKRVPTTQTSDFILPIPPIPIERCLAIAHREALKNGALNGFRTVTGVALARDLVGVVAKLESLGESYSSDPSSLFANYSSRCDPPLTSDEQAGIWKATDGVFSPSINDDAAFQKCIDKWKRECADKQSGKQTRTSNLSQINTASTQSGLSIADYELLAQQLGFKLILNHKNEIQSSLVRLTLDLFNLVGDTLKLNLMSREYELAGEQVDINNAQSFVAQKLGYDATTEKCILAIHAIANKQAYHPVSDYLACLKTKPELVDFDVLENMATLFLGNLDPLANKMMAKKLIASVARVMRPGCKDDTLLVLQGNQGARKSTFLSALADPDWFCDDIRDLDNKDELAKLSRHWILELAEVDYLMGRKEVESFKRFLSTTTDTYRPPYGRANIRIARSCSFFATTNKSEFLADPTGDRRYWVIEVMQKIDCELVATYRDMIWASALAAYERGDNWWLSDEEDVSRDSSHSKYRESDAWVDVILGGENELPTTTHGTGEYIKVNQIFDQLCLTPIQRDRKASNRVVKVLLELGFESRVLRIETKNQKVWYREKPLPSLKPLPILKKMSSGYDPVVEPLLPMLPMLPSLKDDRKKKANEELQENRTEKEEKEDMDLFAISGKIGSVGSVGDNGSTTGVQPLPISKKIGSGEKIGSGLKSNDMGNKELERLPSNDSKCYPEVLVSAPIALLRGDRVKNKKTGEEGIIDLWADNRRKATIKLDNGDLSDWLITSDLELLQRG